MYLLQSWLRTAENQSKGTFGVGLLGISPAFDYTTLIASSSPRIFHWIGEGGRGVGGEKRLNSPEGVDVNSFHSS